jgi:hypothetical protein
MKEPLEAAARQPRRYNKGSPSDRPDQSFVAAILPYLSPDGIFGKDREFYREFCKVTPSGTLETANSYVNAGRYTQIPYSKEQGIISAEQGIVFTEHGISTANTEFCKKVNQPRNTV